MFARLRRIHPALILAALDLFGLAVASYLSIVELGGDAERRLEARRGRVRVRHGDDEMVDPQQHAGSVRGPGSRHAAREPVPFGP